MIWSDIATWAGPTDNRTEGGMANPPRGLVLHIASGYYDGTISWQHRSTGSSRTSSHFIVARDGRCAQMVDTADASWAQRSGNGTWLSVELEGFAPEDPLHDIHPGWETATPQQLEVCARLLARAHTVYGVPLQLATSPSGRGLGHHSMGAESGDDWGHSLCPGTAIKAQKPTILARAQQLAAGVNDEGDDMGASFGPVQLEQGTTSLVIPPVQAGVADPRQVWLNVAADSFGQAYRLRIWGSNGDGNFFPVGNASGVHTLHSGVVFVVQLPQYLRLLTITRQAIGAPDQPNGTPSAGGGEPAPEPQPYAGSISVCFERS